MILFTNEIIYSKDAKDNNVEIIDKAEFKIRDKSVQSKKIYYSTSMTATDIDKDSQDLYFVDFTIILGKRNVPADFIKNGRIIEKMKPGYFLDIAEYEPEPEYERFTNFYGGKSLFSSINKINYFPDAKIIVGYGYSSLEKVAFEESLNKKRKYFIILALKNAVKIFSFDSKEKFEKEAKNRLKIKEIKLKAVKDFFYSNARKAILSNNITPFKNPYPVSDEIERRYGIKKNKDVTGATGTTGVKP